jgi:hypothetical protein
MAMQHRHISIIPDIPFSTCALWLGNVKYLVMAGVTPFQQTDRPRTDRRTIMKATVSDVATVLAVAAMAALGGALGVYAEYDDSPGGVVIGFFLIIGAVALGVWAAQRRR